MPTTETARPSPLVLAPRSGTHTHTVILLHGRGRDPASLARALLCAPPTALLDALPHAKFVLPFARRQRATVYRRAGVRQWFDDWHLTPARSDTITAQYDHGLQTLGLDDTVAYLHALLAAEARLVGARSLVLGGFSQGAAAALVAALLWPGNLAGVVALSAWLPYSRQLRQTLDGQDVVGGREASERAESSLGDRVAAQGASARAAALDWLREEIDLPAGAGDATVGGPTAATTTPVLLCHGVDDDKVRVEQSERAAGLLPALGLGPVVWKQYGGVVHEVSDDMVADVAAFLQRVLDHAEVDTAA